MSSAVLILRLMLGLCSIKYTVVSCQCQRAPRSVVGLLQNCWTLEEQKVQHQQQWGAAVTQALQP